ncbi:MAG TPA: hypothetical protein VFU40_04490 [Gemmatimonadales bacterium]|nr:hypothetical protein [Gemmatimonadales bacterium]
MRTRLPLLGLLAIDLALSGPIRNDIQAQSAAPSNAKAGAMHASSPSGVASKRAEKKKGWRVSPALVANAEFDNNVFLLSAGKKDNLTNPSAGEVVSGRYADMESASDLLTTLSAGLAVKGPGLFGRSSQLVPEVAYELYTRNTERSNVSLGLSLQQELSAGSHVRLSGQLTPSYFARNYMTDAIDQDLSGSITPEERVYERGEYRETQVGADYRVRLMKAGRRHPAGASLQLGGGYYSRSYDPALRGRDLKGPALTTRLLLDFGQRLSLNLGYEYSSLGATRSNQVLLVDEPDVGQDVNGNGNATDLEARALTMVDRSRREHSLNASLQIEPRKSVELSLGYEHRWRRYTSQESLDVVNRGRRDARDQLAADARFRVARNLRLRIGGVHSVQNLNRTGDPAGEIDDYTRSQARLGLSYQL